MIEAVRCGALAISCISRLRTALSISSGSSPDRLLLISGIAVSNVKEGEPVLLEFSFLSGNRLIH